MATRRQETQRLLSGRNAANPVEMSSDFNLTVGAQKGVGGVMRAARPQGNIGDSSLQVLDGLAQWGSKKIRAAAKTRYETLAMDGAMAYQQGKAADELPMDGNKWMLEGYRTMEAETISSALFAAQQEEISLSLHESDPDAFRARYTDRLNKALAGKDERTQEMIKKRTLEQMPQLVAQHTREHARYQEGQTYDALTSTIDVMSRDPANTDRLLDFALGGTASAGLSEERRQSAVIDGVVRAYANDNPLAFAVLEEQGVFDNLTTQEAAALRGAQESYESRVRSKYDETRFNEERALMQTIATGELTPEEAVMAWAEFTTRHGLTMGADEAHSIAGAAENSNEAHIKAVGLEIETAKINGDYGRVADLSYEYASRAGKGGAAGPWLKYENTNAVRNDPIQPELIAGMSFLEDMGIEMRVISGGQESAEEIKATGKGSRKGKTVNHDHGNAADVDFYKDGRKLLPTNPDDLPILQEIIRTAKSRGVVSFGEGEGYMGSGRVHIGFGAERVWGSDYTSKTAPAWLVEAAGSVKAGPRVAADTVNIDVDPEKWKTLVDYYKGDLEMAAVAYATDTLRADTWNELGRKAEGLSPETAAFVERFTNNVSGQRYVSAQDRLAVANEAYTVAREAAAVDVYSRIAPELDRLGREYSSGYLNRSEYEEKTQALRDEWGVATTKADVDQMIALGNVRQAALEADAQARVTAAMDAAKITSETLDDPAWIAARKEEEYAQRVAAFDVERQAADNALMDAIEAITTSEKPEGVTDSAFLQSQQEAIVAAQAQHQLEVKATAGAYGIEWKDSAAVETAKKGIEQVREGFAKALKNTQDVAIMERAVATGTLDKQTQEIKDRAYETALGDIAANTERFATSPKKDGSMPTQDEVALFQQTAMEDWFAKTNYVPAQVRNEFSSVVTGQLVTPDGVVSQHALDAIMAYQTLKMKSPVAADKLLDPQAKVIAEAALSTAGTPEALPRVLLDMWAQGLNSPFAGKPSPNFTERSDVQAMLAERVAKSSVFDKMFGESPIGALRLTEASRADLQGVLEAHIQKLHALNPNLNPKYIMAMAEEAVLNSAVPVETSDYRLFGRSSGENTLLVDPSGGNIMEQMFGAQAPSYSSDRLSVSKAITGYINSDEFKGQYGDMTPSMGIGEMMWATLPFTENTMLRATNHSLPVFTAQHVGNGRLYLDFTLDSDGTTASVVLPLEEVGAWYKKSVQGELTK